MKFLPIAFRRALRLSQVAVDEALASPGLLTPCVRDLVRLLAPPLTVNHFDLAALAQAAGCLVERSWEGYRVVSRPPEPLKALTALAEKGALRDAPCVSTILESTSRLAVELQGKSGVVAVAPGPLSLLTQLFGPQGEPSEEGMEVAGEILVQLVTECCDRGAHMILIAEELPGRPQRGLMASSRECLSPVWNVARYYGRRSIYLVRADLDEAGADLALGIGSDRVALPPGKGETASHAGRRCPTLPLSLLGAHMEGMRSAVADLLPSPGEGDPVLTEWEIPADTDLQALLALIAAVGEKG